MDEDIQPTEEYLQQTLIPSTTTQEKQRQLLILDLNGTLCSRTKAKTAFFARPHCPSFFDYIFKTFTVMVWSSAQEKAVRRMCKMFSPHEPIATWDRSHFNLTMEQFNSDTETLKDLDLIWNNIPQFNATNTIVLDDSTYKLSAQIFNLMKMSTFDHTTLMKDTTKKDHDLWKAANYLNVLSHETNVSNYVRLHPFDINLDYGTINTKIDRDCGHYIGGNLAFPQKRSVIPPELEDQINAIYKNAFAIPLPDGTTAGEKPVKKNRSRSKNTDILGINNPLESDASPNSEVIEPSPKKKKKNKKKKNESTSPEPTIDVKEEEVKQELEDIQPNPLEYLFMQAIAAADVKSEPEEPIINGEDRDQEEMMDESVEYSEYNEERGDEESMEEGEYMPISLDQEVEYRGSDIIMPNPLESFYNNAFNVQPTVTPPPQPATPQSHPPGTIIRRNGETTAQAVLRLMREKRRSKRLVAKEGTVVSAGRYQKKAAKRKLNKAAKAKVKKRK